MLGLYNGNNDPATATPNQFLLANTLGQEVNDDLVAQNGQFEHDWFDRGTNVTLDRSDIEFGEINNTSINNEFDATIVEVAFHDNQHGRGADARAKVRDAVARATYQGLVKYFRAVDGNTTPATELPPPVTGVHAESNAAGSVTISWMPPVANAYAGRRGDRLSHLRLDERLWLRRRHVRRRRRHDTATLTGYDPDAAVLLQGRGRERRAANRRLGSRSPCCPAAGRSRCSSSMASTGSTARSTRKQPLPAPDNTVDRVRPRDSNSRDYVVQVATAIHAAAPGMHVTSASNEAVISGAVNLTDYDTVIWILGEESTADDTFNATEQTKVEQFIAGGGNLFLSGAEIAWDLDQPRTTAASFFENTLKGNYVSDDANTYTVTAVGGGIFAGLLNFSFDNGTLFYNVEFPDVINPQAGAQAALSYVGGTGGNAAIQAAGTGGRGNIVMLGFPFETITTAANRAAVIDRVFDFFGLNEIPPNADFNQRRHGRQRRLRRVAQDQRHERAMRLGRRRRLERPGEQRRLS